MESIKRNMELQKGPILITGTFRSGTTLVAQMMRSHPKVELIYDTVNFMRFSYKRYDPIEDFSNVEALVGEIGQRISGRFGMLLAEEKVLNRLQGCELSYASVYDALMQELLLSGSRASIWGEKTTLVWTKIPDFFKMFPGGRVIHIIRDPRAVVASWRQMTRAPGNDYLDAIFNCVDSMEQMKNYNTRFKNKRYAAVRYEDLAARPAEAAQSICRKLDLEFHQNMLNSDSYMTKSHARWIGNSMFVKEMARISTETVARWREELADWEVWLVEFLAGEAMEEYGYQKINPGSFDSLADRAVAEVESSRLVVNGALRFLFKKRGMERFPTDPLDRRNWDEGARKY